MASKQLAALRARLQKHQRKLHEEEELSSDISGHHTWISRISNNGNKPECWLEYLRFVKQNLKFDNLSNQQEYLCTIYDKVFKSIPVDEYKKNEAYAKLFIGYANLKSEIMSGDAQALFNHARVIVKKFAFVHVEAAQFEIQQDNREKGQKILEKAKLFQAEPIELINKALRNLLSGRDRLLDDEDRGYLLDDSANNSDQNSACKANKPTNVSGLLVEKTLISPVDTVITFKGLQAAAIPNRQPQSRSPPEDNIETIPIVCAPKTTASGTGWSEHSSHRIHTPLKKYKSAPDMIRHDVSAATASTGRKKSNPRETDKCELRKQRKDFNFEDTISELEEYEVKNSTYHGKSNVSDANHIDVEMKENSFEPRSSSTVVKKNPPVCFRPVSTAGKQYISQVDYDTSYPNLPQGPSKGPRSLLFSMKNHRPSCNLGTMFEEQNSMDSSCLQTPTDSLSSWKDGCSEQQGTLTNPPYTSCKESNDSFRDSEPALLLRSTTNSRRLTPIDVGSPMRVPIQPMPYDLDDSTDDEKGMSPLPPMEHSFTNQDHTSGYCTQEEEMSSMETKSKDVNDGSDSDNRAMQNEPRPVHDFLARDLSACKTENKLHRTIEMTDVSECLSKTFAGSKDMTVTSNKSANYQQNTSSTVIAFHKSQSTSIPALPHENPPGGGTVASQLTNQAHCSKDPTGGGIPARQLTNQAQIQKNPPGGAIFAQQLSNHRPPVVKAFSQPPQPVCAVPNQNSVPQIHPQQQVTLPPTPGVLPRDVLTINGKAYSILNILGKGGSSKVYRVFDSTKNLILAVKCVNLEDTDEAILQGYINEITLLQKLQYSDKVIKLHDHEYRPEMNILYVVMEAGDTDLATLFRNRKEKDKVTIKYFWSEMLQAVQVLHKEGIVHSDLKPANFLLVVGKLKLIDFGIANAIQQDKTSVIRDARVGTLNYMSPEAIMDTCSGYEADKDGVIRPKYKIRVLSDVWSLGCILYDMVYGRTPFQHISKMIAKIQAITNPRFQIEFPEIPDKQLHDVLKKCLIRNPKERASIDQLLNHPYLTEQIKQEEQKVEISPDTSQHSVEMLLQQLTNFSPSMTLSVGELTKGLLQQLKTGHNMNVGKVLKSSVSENPSHPSKPASANTAIKAHANGHPNVRQVRPPLQSLNLQDLKRNTNSS